MLSEVNCLVIAGGHEDSPAEVSAEDLILSEAGRMLYSLDCVPVDGDVHAALLVVLDWSVAAGGQDTRLTENCNIGSRISSSLLHMADFDFKHEFRLFEHKRFQ